MTSRTTAAVTTPPRVTRIKLSTRTRLATSLAIAGLLALITILQAFNTYTGAFERFRSIAEDSTAKVDASEAALRAVARIDSGAAVFVATAPDNNTHWDSQAAIHASFDDFRNQMFIIRARLTNPDVSSDAETIDYTQISYFTFDQFWQHIGNLLTAEQNGDTATATQEYIIADNYFQNQIIRYLLDLESRNFSAMQDTSSGAADAINQQTVLLGIAAFVLIVLLTALSFWLRWRVRRVLTPGLDVAFVLGWVLAIVMILELTATPGRLQAMVQDAYYSVSASARVLAVANQSASAQSGKVIDPGHADFWQTSFANDLNSIALRICGQPNCLNKPFTVSDSPDALDPIVLRDAINVSDTNRQAINTQDINRQANSGIGSLIANITTPGEAAKLEQARQAIVRYNGINDQVSALVAKGSLEDASRLSTGDGQKALADFSQAILDEQNIKRNKFNSIWTTEQADLPTHRWLFGVAGYAVLIIALLIGAVQRLREL